MLLNCFENCEESGLYNFGKIFFLSWQKKGCKIRDEYCSFFCEAVNFSQII